MPELAEVAFYARQWDAGLHKTVQRVHVHARARVFRGTDGNAIARALTGARLLQSLSHGKNLLFHFSGGLWLGGHLGMSGKLLVAKPEHTAEKHDHLVLYTRDAALVFHDPRMFGRIRLDRGHAAPAWWETLPPAVTSRGFSVRHVREILTRFRRRPLKSLLLDQRCFPGIGNWMADEILWQMRVRPAQLAGEIDATTLHRTVRRVTHGALRTVGRDWSDPPRTWLFSHRWKSGGRCPRCREPLTRDDLGGRTTCWCPRCVR